jgi:hypothetical protein
VIELEPVGNAVVVIVPTPLLSVAVPSDVVPLKNWTVPVGVPPPGLTGATVADKLTVWPRLDGLGEAVTVVVVLAWLTVAGVAAEVLAPKVVSPEYCAVIESEPVGNAVVVIVADPLLRVAVPSEVVPLKNWTVPVGVPTPEVPDVTLAVRVTDWPVTDGLGVTVTVVVADTLPGETV